MSTEAVMTGSGEHCDVIVLGVGTSGEDLALRLAGAGLEVVGVTDELVGGECAYWACIPSKMMIRAASLLQEARRVDGAAGSVAVTPDWSVVAARVRDEAAGGWDDATAVARFEARGGQLVRGRGRLTGPRTVAVGDRTFTARRGIVIATGSKPLVPPIPGLADIGYWTTHDAIKVRELPGSLFVLGGGAVGCELGQVFARFGVEVTIVEGADRLLPMEEPEAGAVVADALADDGIAVRTGSRVEQVVADGDSIVVTTSGGTTLAGERLLVATGRAPMLDDLGLDAAGIDGSSGAILVDGQLRAADGVWAIGDVTGFSMFTHVALHQARIAGADILGENPLASDYRAVPRVTFTDPEVGAVGMTETQARAAGLDVAVTVKTLAATFRGWLHGPGSAGLVKLVADRGTDTLVGATAVGPAGGEVLGLLGLAVHARVPLAELRRMIYAFPTFHGAVGEAVGAYALGLQDVLDPGGDRTLHT
jgi:pyruvate/2-oxoglutarate dehydrogenase complex dihydrolipoamide dehydrogenase (E3) component